MRASDALTIDTRAFGLHLIGSLRGTVCFQKGPPTSRVKQGADMVYKWLGNYAIKLEVEIEMWWNPGSPFTMPAWTFEDSLLVEKAKKSR